MAEKRMFSLLAIKRDTLAVTLFFTLFISATYGFGRYLFPVLVPDMRAEIGFDYMTVGIMSSCALTAYLLSSFSCGFLTSRIGPKQMILGAVLLCGSCLVAMGFADNIRTITVLLVILGCCPAFAWVPMVAGGKGTHPLSPPGQGPGVGVQRHQLRCFRQRLDPG